MSIAKYHIIWSNRSAPSSSRRIDGWCQSNLIMPSDTVKHSWQSLSALLSIHLLSRPRIENGRQCHSRLWSWLSIRKNPCIYVHNIFKGNGFLTLWLGISYFPFTIRTQETVLSKRRFDHDFDTVNVFDEDRLSHPRLGQVSFFWESTLLLGMIIQLEVMWYSRHRFFISFVLLQVAWRIVLFHFKQRHSTVWINFWSSGSCLNLCSLSRSKFPYNSALMWGTAMWRSVRICIVSKSSFDASFPSAPLENSLHNSATAPLLLSWLTEITVRRISSMFSSLPLRSE